MNRQSKNYSRKFSIFGILVVCLSSALLRKVSLDQQKTTATTGDAERLLREADACFRCAQVSGLRNEIAEGLQAAGHELMAKATAIESKLQRTRNRCS